MTQIMKIEITAVIMFLIGFSSFIQSWIMYNDFWLPLAYQNVVYRRFLDTKANEIFSIPFLWWLDYAYWIFHSSSIFELAHFILGVLTFGLGLFSVYKLIKWSQIEKLEYSYDNNSNKPMNTILFYHIYLSLLCQKSVKLLLLIACIVSYTNILLKCPFFCT